MARQIAAYNAIVMPGGFSAENKRPRIRGQIAPDSTKARSKAATRAISCPCRMRKRKRKKRTTKMSRSPPQGRAGMSSLALFCAFLRHPELLAEPTYSRVEPLLVVIAVAAVGHGLDGVREVGLDARHIEVVGVQHRRPRLAERLRGHSLSLNSRR